MTHRRRTQSPGDSPPPARTVLDAASVEAVARRVVELIRGEGDSPVGHGLVDAATLAAELGVERSWVYAHRAELGAIQLGTGSKPRLRFDMAAAREVLARSGSHESHEPQTPAPVSRLASRRRQRTASRVGLLPIKGLATLADARRERSR